MYASVCVWVCEGVYVFEGVRVWWCVCGCVCVWGYMFVCVCMQLRVCGCLCSRVSEGVWLAAYLVGVRICMWGCMCVCVFVCEYEGECLCVSEEVCVCAGVSIWRCVCMCVCISLYFGGKLLFMLICLKTYLKTKCLRRSLMILLLRFFGLLCSSLLFFPQRFGWYVHRPSSGGCRIREPSRPAGHIA